MQHRVEAHVLGYAGDLYERRVRLLFVQRLGDEMRFPDLEALKAQIATDAARAGAILQQVAERS